MFGCGVQFIGKRRIQSHGCDGVICNRIRSKNQHRNQCISNHHYADAVGRHCSRLNDKDEFPSGVEH